MNNEQPDTQPRFSWKISTCATPLHSAKLNDICGAFAVRYGAFDLQHFLMELALGDSIQIENTVDIRIINVGVMASPIITHTFKRIS